MSGFGQMKNVAEIGDIVTIEDYEGEYQVDSYTHELSYMRASEDFNDIAVEETILYDVICLDTYEYLLAFQEDISVKIKADKSTSYLREKIKNEVKQMQDKKQPPENPRKRELTKQERIDRLLTEISDYRDLIKMFGDDSGEYRAKMRTAEIRISELTEHDRRRAGLD